MLLEIPTSLSAGKVMQLLKGGTSHMLQDEFPQLKKRYWGQHLWARGYYPKIEPNVSIHAFSAL